MEFVVRWVYVEFVINCIMCYDMMEAGIFSLLSR